MNFKVFILLFCLIQVAFFQSRTDNTFTDNTDDNTDDSDDNRPPPLYNNRNSCKIDIEPTDYETRLRAGSAVLARNNYLLREVEYEGLCNCNLYLYSQRNYGGQVLNYPFSRSNGNDIYPRRIWNQVTRSFRIVCTF